MSHAVVVVVGEGTRMWYAPRVVVQRLDCRRCYNTRRCTTIITIVKQRSGPVQAAEQEVSNRIILMESAERVVYLLVSPCAASNSCRSGFFYLC